MLFAAGFVQVAGEGDEGDILVHVKSRENQLRVTYVNQFLQEVLWSGGLGDSLQNWWEYEAVGNILFKK